MALCEDKTDEGLEIEFSDLFPNCSVHSIGDANEKVLVLTDGMPLEWLNNRARQLGRVPAQNLSGRFIGEHAIVDLARRSDGSFVVVRETP